MRQRCRLILIGWRRFRRSSGTITATIIGCCYDICQRIAARRWKIAGPVCVRKYVGESSEV